MASNLRGSPTPWPYFLIRLLFKFVLKIFYGTIVVENADLIPPRGVPCIVCTNHSNSLTDAVLLVGSVPSKRRNLLRLTAKSAQFGHKTFTSWLIEAAGTVPIIRRKDSKDADQVDNTVVMTKLMEALELGDAICMFPEGMSRYHPTIAPLKTGVARMISDTLSRNRDNPEFEVALQTCSITYMHREHWRSDVLITVHPPKRYSVKDNPELLAPVDFGKIRAMTEDMRRQISSGTFDSPSWNYVRSARLGARLYAPFGTRMSLGDHVRVVIAFLDAFKTLDETSQGHADTEDESALVEDTNDITHQQLRALHNDLNAYQDQLARWGIKDDRIRRPLPRRIIFTRLVVRLTWSLFLFTISLPGLSLWLPVMMVTFYAVKNFKKSGPIWDTWDEIAQYKLIYGLISGLCVWWGAVLLTLPFAYITFFITPALMWITLRWMEDAISAFRAFTALLRLLRVGKPTLKDMHEKRRGLLQRVMQLAVHDLKLPEDPEAYFVASGKREKGRVSGPWDSSKRYFSIRRRRKQDWGETLRLYDKVDYPTL